MFELTATEKTLGFHCCKTPPYFNPEFGMLTYVKVIADN